MPINDADRRAHVRSIGEAFDTGYTEDLYGVFNWDFDESEFAAGAPVERRNPRLVIVTSDIAIHSLVKDSALRRVIDDETFRVRRFEPLGDGSMTRVRLKK